jgi:uncharacterized OB-fold protein
MPEDTRSPLIVNNPETQPFWESAAEGRFIVRYCIACNRAHWYPRAICPFCFSDKTEWKQASGNGTVYSYSVMRRVPEPYAIAYVTLEEGPKMLTNLVECNFDAIRIGQRVKVVFKPSSEGMQLPMFTPA